MTTFQIIGVATTVLMAAVTAAGLARRRRQVGVRVVLFFTWLLAAAAILRPDVSMRLANAVGIGRGTDFLLYVSILASIAILFMIYFRFVTLESQLTQVVRHLAILEAHRAFPSEPVQWTTEDPEG